MTEQPAAPSAPRPHDARGERSPDQVPLLPILAADLARGTAAATIGCAAVALAEYVLALVFSQGPVRLATLWRFALLDVTLVALMGLVLAPVLGIALAAMRATHALFSPDGARARPLLGQEGPHRTGAPSALVPWLWALLFTGIGFLLASFFATRLFLGRFKEPTLIAATLAVIQLGLLAALGLIAALMAVGLNRAARALYPLLGRASPLSHRLPAVLAMAALLAPWVLLLLKRAPQVREVAPWRDILATAVFLAATFAGARLVHARGGLLPRERRARRAVLVSSLIAYLVVAPLALWKLGADPETKYLAITASPTLSHLVDLVRRANDFDRDGYGTLLGENDCAPWNKKIHPNARDIPDNGVDENCSGRDFSTKGGPSYKAGEKLPIPPEYRRDWNFLLITVDTVRYDHTTMGGYKERRGRDTTPRLAELASRSISFSFANAPSAGTMASIPAILTSKFFHTGIALMPPRRNPAPPILKPENTLLAEVMKRGGYRTGAILTHEYFNDWGLDQGVDSYDISIGAKPDAFRISSHDVTDKAQAWIARHGSTKWFLWAHYIDPHGRYVAHPGETQYGAEEEDLYDGELAYTDKHLGRLLDFLSRSPAANRTIVIITSDHGDGFREHGFINHGMALYKELLHVPLIFYIPEGEPRVVDGAVSPMDIFPTMAELAGIDISDLSLEGESLIPQLFYGRDAKHRTVFAETNWPDPLRAAVTHDYKLVFNLKTNIYQLFDLRSDPWEKKNLWGKDGPGTQRMKDVLNEWLDRVYFSRDPANQAQEARAKVLMTGRPKPQQPADATLVPSIRLIGWDTAVPEINAGNELQLTVYLEALKPTETIFKLEASASPIPFDAPLVKRMMAGNPGSVRQEKNPADGTFPTTRWKAGDFIKETFTLRVPKEWQPGNVYLGFRLTGDKSQAAPKAGSLSPDGLVVLGSIPLRAPATTR
ncbi:MAG: sulfatase-like hydrolase/transferase [Deltaproteobacteria bacterium]|nr:sulfatase-like hydrolase/transferase [Deltaproteobacteria bacterium]